MGDVQHSKLTNPKNMSTPNESFLPTLLYGTMTASSPDFPDHTNPTGWSKSPDHMNIDNNEGLVGHCWKALTITTDYTVSHTITGIQTNSNQFFYIEYSSDGEVWKRVEGEFKGDDKNVLQPLKPFVCVQTRMVWADTSGTNGFNTQFVGVESNTIECEEKDVCADEQRFLCSDDMFHKACVHLQERIDTHVESVEEEMQCTEDACMEESALSHDEWRGRLDKSIDDFDAHYTQKVAEMKDVLQKKRVEHEARMKQIQAEFALDRQVAYDDTLLAIQKNMESLWLSVSGIII